MTRIYESFCWLLTSLIAAWHYVTGDADVRAGILLTVCLGMAAWCGWLCVRQVGAARDIRQRLKTNRGQHAN